MIPQLQIFSLSEYRLADFLVEVRGGGGGENNKIHRWPKALGIIEELYLSNLQQYLNNSH